MNVVLLFSKSANILFLYFSLIHLFSNSFLYEITHIRGTPFFSKLSGTVTATPGSSLIKTSVDLTKEIRRGGI